jgi:hypothetical protein
VFFVDGYNISNGSNENIDSENIDTLIDAHDYVILDESFTDHGAALLTHSASN